MKPEMLERIAIALERIADSLGALAKKQFKDEIIFQEMAPPNPAKPPRKVVRSSFR